MAQLNLGVMYHNGEGVLKSDVLAHMWWTIAMKNGSETAREIRGNFQLSMTSADISKAQKKARVCMESNYQDCD